MTEGSPYPYMVDGLDMVLRVHALEDCWVTKGLNVIQK